MQGLKTQVQALKDQNARIEKRLDRLELREAVRSRPASSERKPKEEVPSLTVVRLKPKPNAAPKISTSVEVVEPMSEELEALSPPPQEPERGDEVDLAQGEAIFESGVAALKTGNVAGGVDRLQSFAAQNPKHPKADNAIYFTGVGLMGLNDYEDAATAFEKLISSYPASDAVVEAQLRLAECRARLGRTAEAREAYEKLVREHPGTAAAAQATARLATLKEDRTAQAPKEP
ncbi:MAG: tetratricopeptide repeat protein [Myxococcales bacterium]|nr:tetratricopeptide repeat protein [Myxococcales bacterium]